MKTLKYFMFLFLISLVAISCDERDIDMPPLPIPEYTGDPANITIRELKERYNADLTLIEDTLIIEARVIGNDISGNIYKQMIIQDEDGYGIVLSIDFTGAFGLYPVGQKLFIHLKGLYIGKYGGEHQIGANNAGSIGRMSKLAFDEHVFKDGNPIKMQPRDIRIADIIVNSGSFVNTLVRIDDVEFVDGGNAIFATTDASATNRDIVDASGNKMIVRTSQYANFAKNMLPVGSGSIVGILGRFNGEWQFTLRADFDLVGFGEKGTKGNPFTVSEAMAKDMDGSTRSWVKGYIVGSAGLGISESNPIINASGVILTAPFLKNSIVIAEKADETDWQKLMVIQLPAGTDIESINLEDNPDNKGKEVAIYGALNNVFGRPGIQTNGTANDYIFDTSDPSEETFFSETFGTGSYPSGNRPKIAEFTDFDMKYPIVYSDASGKADIRTSGTASVWFPKGADVFLTITGINTTGYSNLRLNYDVAANVYSAGETTDLNSLTVTFNGQSLVIPSKVVNAPDDANKFYTMEVDLSSIPTGNNVTLEFMAPNATNAYGLRLDNIKITGKK